MFDMGDKGLSAECIFEKLKLSTVSSQMKKIDE